MSTIVSKFITAFDPMKRSHVSWLKKMTEIAETLADPNLHRHLVREVNSNPFGVKLDDRDALMWVEIHFGIAMKYTKGVLNSKAIIPAIGQIASGLTAVTEE